MNFANGHAAINAGNFYCAKIGFIDADDLTGRIGNDIAFAVDAEGLTRLYALINTDIKINFATTDLGNGPLCWGLLVNMAGNLADGAV